MNSKQIKATEAAKMIAGKDVVYTGGKTCKGNEIQFDDDEMITIKTWKEQITDSESAYTVTDLIAKDGFTVRFSE